MTAHSLVALWCALLPLQTPSPEPTGDGSPEALVRALYEQHQPWRKKGIQLANRKELGKFLIPQLVYLFLKDDECKRRTKEVCRLDFDPFVAGQDYADAGITDLKMKRLGPAAPCLEPIPDVNVKRPPVDPCRLEVTFKNIGAVRLVYQLVQTPLSWRVLDIQYADDRSLKAVLTPSP